ncbi:MAG: putative phospholipid ABC transporter-binding protein MlaD [Syntrophorhabdaceae bacterium PtaU1.Bin034]|jgi:phospholipid/cholesterol/gamma-HCH transport system substrate-binding protein|nr:MAG: putative phospholipid ABC transporter-binding protein MlaD [Syntrophorhabdaceae bacterium PtaU1.Bin034]
METVVGIFVVVGLICIGYLSVKLGKVSIFHESTYTLYARFTSVAGLRVGSPVEVFGIEVGTVSRMGIDKQRQVAWVAIKIQKDVVVYSDGSAAINTAGLIGDKFIKIDPGGAGEPLNPGSYITNTVTPASIEELVGQYIFGQAKAPGGSAPKEGK